MSTSGGAASGVNSSSLGLTYHSTKPTLVDGQGGGIEGGSRGATAVQLMIPDSGNSLNTFSGIGDAQTAAVSGFFSAAFGMVWNGATWDRQRGANIFKAGNATALGSSAIWTPAGGKKFRILGYEVEMSQNVQQAVAGLVTVSLLDGGSAIGLVHSAFVPTAAATTFGPGYTTGMILLGNGYLSSAANNVLNANLGAALTAGEVRVNVWGTEE